ncbi:family 10 glycosylhydrolase [Rapidithrix thailandica]|uniref:Family 10 glycosylhydrolase n=1 Tax=Rapidithrix thailandica TaxID=413964 RepID=A0AAW9SE29_9BACT
MKKKRLLYGILWCLLLPGALWGQNPKREFRAAWIATVSNLDWPSSRNLTVAQQKESLIHILDSLKALNLNAVLFQVRTECDALYRSNLEPWSYYLTGEQGKAPEDPNYDPLSFATEEAHKRGIELHAWLNPYRAAANTAGYAMDESHVTNQHPEWILEFPGIKKKILNPGLPEVETYITSVVRDIVSRYDIDGIHFDDYFYPYPNSSKGFNGISNEDADTYATYGQGFDNIGDWRRENINRLMRSVYQAIKSEKAYVKFGVSPFGIWKNGVPEGIIGMNAYSVIYADALTWLTDEAVDYLTPQLYWVIGGNQDYNKLLPWWSEKAKVANRHLYAGHSLYNVQPQMAPLEDVFLKELTHPAWLTDAQMPGEIFPLQSFDEIPNQIEINRNHRNNNALGSVFFRTGNIMSDPSGMIHHLKNNQYSTVALPPVMPWLGGGLPEVPNNLQYGQLAGSERYALQWDAPGAGEYRYVLYQFTSENPTPEEREIAANILALTGETHSFGANTPPGQTVWYGVSTIDRYGRESALSELLQVATPEAPVLLAPLADEPALAKEFTFEWQAAPGASYYHLQVAEDANFQQLIFENARLEATEASGSPLNLDGNRTYFWRVRAGNIAGLGTYSEVRSFTTGFPAVPVITSPTQKEEFVSLTPEFTWQASEGATTYHLQLSKGGSIFSEDKIIVEVENITELSYVLNTPLDKWYTHYLRISAVNAKGRSAWTVPVQFKTTTDIPEAPTFVSPEHQAIDLPLSLKVEWNTVDFSTGYEFQLASSELFDEQDVLVDEKNLTWNDAFWQVSNLEYHTTYYARVRSKYVGGVAGWSETLRFTTEEKDDIPTGIEDDPTCECTVQIAPNPAREQVKLSFWQAGSGPVRVSLINAMGKTIDLPLDKRLSGGKHELYLETEHLHQGVYWLRFETLQGAIAKRLLVIH